MSGSLAKTSPLHDALLEVHKALLAWARKDYERVHGRQADGAFLNVLTDDAALRWLGALTTLIVGIDELGAAGPEAALSVRRLLAPDASAGAFQQKYAEAMQAEPAVVVAHGQVMRLLPKSPRA